MPLFDVYTQMNVEPAEASGTHLTDKYGKRYLDFYGGHAVISIGHSHPVYVKRLSSQLSRIGFYSNAVINPLQYELATMLGEASGYPDYNLFMCNSGAEANENALKLASFATGREELLAMKASFHGRTSAAVAATDNPSIQAPLNKGHKVTFVEMNDAQALERELLTKKFAAVIIEGIQGVGGIKLPEDDYLNRMRRLCDQTGTVMILDEIQSGYGRTGKFFAHQHAGVKPDMITLAKGMGNGFPVGGVLISPKFEAHKNMLGTTFGGNYLACAASIAVLEVMRDEALTDNASTQGNKLIEKLKVFPGIKGLRGRGLMIGFEIEGITQADFRKKLLEEHGIMTGSAGKYTVRLLPPLSITDEDVDEFIGALALTLEAFGKTK